MPSRKYICDWVKFGVLFGWRSLIEWCEWSNDFLSYVFCYKNQGVISTVYTEHIRNFHTLCTKLTLKQLGSNYEPFLRCVCEKSYRFVMFCWQSVSLTSQASSHHHFRYEYTVADYYLSRSSRILECSYEVTSYQSIFIPLYGPCINLFEQLHCWKFRIWQNFQISLSTHHGMDNICWPMRRTCSE